jgi:hypothetical protein
MAGEPILIVEDLRADEVIPKTKRISLAFGPRRTDSMG